MVNSNHDWGDEPTDSEPQSAKGPFLTDNNAQIQWLQNMFQSFAFLHAKFAPGTKNNFVKDAVSKRFENTADQNTVMSNLASLLSEDKTSRDKLFSLINKNESPKKILADLFAETKHYSTLQHHFNEFQQPEVKVSPTNKINELYEKAIKLVQTYLGEQGLKVENMKKNKSASARFFTEKELSRGVRRSKVYLQLLLNAVHSPRQQLYIIAAIAMNDDSKTLKSRMRKLITPKEITLLINEIFTNPDVKNIVDPINKKTNKPPEDPTREMVAKLFQPELDAIDKKPFIESIKPPKS